MRTLTTTTALGVIATLGLAMPAEAAQVADPAPSNVKVAWADAAHTKIGVTWSEVGSVPNKVIPEYAGAAKAGIYTTADAPNQVDLTVNDIVGDDGQPAVRIAVYVGTDQGGTTSPAGLSVAFDTLRGVKPVIDKIASVPPNKLKVTWHSVPAAADPNPGDPLDLAPAAPKYQVVANRADLNGYPPVTPPSSATEATFQPETKPPFRLSVFSANEWGQLYAQTLRIDYDSFASLSIPSAVNYGQPTVIKGKLVRWTQACDPGPCWKYDVAEPPRLVILHARANASSPWYVVGTTKTSSTGTFSFAPTTLGTRQYRVVVPDVYDATGLGVGVTSGSATTLATPRVAGSFADATVAYGQKVTARVTIAPPANVRSTLQRWDGKAWRDLKWVYTSKGAGSYTFTATQRGRYAYRFLVPAFTYAGRPLSWQVSANFVLTTS